MPSKRMSRKNKCQYQLKNLRPPVALKTKSPARRLCLSQKEQKQKGFPLSSLVVVVALVVGIFGSHLKSDIIGMAPLPPPEGGEGGKNKSKKKQEEDDSDSESDREEGGYIIGDDVYVPPPPAKPIFSGEETGRRLVITYIVNTNFKSYAGRTVLGPFHKVCVSCQ